MHFLFLINPKKAQRLASIEKIEDSSGSLALVIMLFIFGSALWCTVLALKRSPLQGALNLSQLIFALAVLGKVLKKLKPVSRNTVEALKRLCLVACSVFILWICIGSIFLLVATTLHLNARVFDTGFFIIEVIFYTGILIHIFEFGSQVPKLMTNE